MSFRTRSCPVFTGRVRLSSELAWLASRHQIRVHMAHIGHAVVSDGKYTCAGLKGLRLEVHRCPSGMQIWEETDET